MLKEIVMVLLNDKTIMEVQNQFISRKKKVPIDTSDKSFRLYLSDEENINLELLMRDDYGFYFKPIGYYEKNGNIKVLKEFEDTYISIEKEISEDVKNKVSFLDIDSNTYIAICSREVSNIVKEIFNGKRTPPFKIMANGVETTVFQSMWEALEAKVTDNDYESEEDIFVMFQNQGNGISLHCNEDLYNQLFEKGLLTALKYD